MPRTRTSNRGTSAILGGSILGGSILGDFCAAAVSRGHVCDRTSLTRRTRTSNQGTSAILGGSILGDFCATMAIIERKWSDCLVVDHLAVGV